MDRDTEFCSSCLEWLGRTWERLEELDLEETYSDRPAQSPAFSFMLRRLRREIEILASSVQTQRSLGMVDAAAAHDFILVLHDLRWLLEIPVAAAPALARQCVRMAQDRIRAAVEESPPALEYHEAGVAARLRGELVSAS